MSTETERYVGVAGEAVSRESWTTDNPVLDHQTAMNIIYKLVVLAPL